MIAIDISASLPHFVVDFGLGVDHLPVGKQVRILKLNYKREIFLNSTFVSKNYVCRLRITLLRCNSGKSVAGLAVTAVHFHFRKTKFCVSCSFEETRKAIRFVTNG